MTPGIYGGIFVTLFIKGRVSPCACWSNTLWRRMGEWRYSSAMDGGV